MSWRRNEQWVSPSSIEYFSCKHISLLSHSNNVLYIDYFSEINFLWSTVPLVTKSGVYKMIQWFRVIVSVYDQPKSGEPILLTELLLQDRVYANGSWFLLVSYLANFSTGLIFRNHSINLYTWLTGRSRIIKSPRQLLDALFGRGSREIRFHEDCPLLFGDIHS